MPLESYVSVAEVIGAAYLGLRLWLRYMRTQSRFTLYMAAPVLLIASGLVVTVVGTWALTGRPTLQAGGIPPAFRPVLLIAIGLMPGLCAHFFVQVFHRTHRSMWLAYGVFSLAFLAGTVHVAWTSPGGYLVASLGSRVDQALYSGGLLGIFGLGARDSFLHWRAYQADWRRGRSLEPVVIDRFWLWCVMAVAFCIHALAAAGFLPEHGFWEQPLVLRLLYMGTGVVAGVAGYLSWVPAGWYQRWVAHRYPQPTPVSSA